MGWNLRATPQKFNLSSRKSSHLHLCFFLHYKLFNQLIWDGWLPHKLNLLSLALHSARSVCPAHAVARSVSWGYLGAGNHLGD